MVDDGDIVTAGAPSCGLDLALHLLERLGGPGLGRGRRARAADGGHQTGQASSRSASARRNWAASAPSSARWSQLMHR